MPGFDPDGLGANPSEAASAFGAMTDGRWQMAKAAVPRLCGMRGDWSFDSGFWSSARRAVVKSHHVWPIPRKRRDSKLPERPISIAPLHNLQCAGL